MDTPDAESGFFYFGEESQNVVALSITHGAMAISAGSANPERALMVSCGASTAMLIIFIPFFG